MHRWALQLVTRLRHRLCSMSSHLMVMCRRLLFTHLQLRRTTFRRLHSCTGHSTGHMIDVWDASFQVFQVLTMHCGGSGSS